MIKTKELVKEYLEYLERHSFKTVLDLGCGSGKKSLRFAKKGVKVTGVDWRGQSILVSDKNFKFIKNNIINFQSEKKYDLIIALFTLHFLKKEEAIKIIKKMKEKTKKGGFNFLICLTKKDACFKEKPKNFYPDYKSLKKLYSKWELIKKDQGFTEMEDYNDQGPHRHNIIFLITKKCI